MTLRLRLTLLTTVVVALVLAASGVGLHLLLATRLLQGLDENLQQASGLLLSTVEEDDGRPSLSQHGEMPPTLRADLSAILIDASGRILDQLGSIPASLPRASPGFSTQGDWRVYTEVTGSLALLTMRELEGVTDSLRRFDASFMLLAPLALLLAFGLAYTFARQALRPVDKLTRAALDLARRRAWRERLPTPRQRDELWRLSEATNTLLGALAGVIERERRFTADAAHELRTPLTVLRGRLEKALEQDDPVRSSASLRKALGASDDLLDLVVTLLALARAEAGQHPPSEPVALDEVARHVTALVEPQFLRNGLRLVLDLPEDAVWVRGDGAALGLLVRNLLDNALKFTTHKEVTLRLSARDDQGILTIDDCGPGIPEEALPHLFERFYQADARHRRTGSGLGLALVDSVATWHGGSVRAENRAEGGARFVVTLPLVKRGLAGSGDRA